MSPLAGIKVGRIRDKGKSKNVVKKINSRAHLGFVDVGRSSVHVGLIARFLAGYVILREKSVCF